MGPSSLSYGVCSVKPPSAVMKLNISYPATGAQKLVDIEDEKKVRIFYGKRMGAEVEVDTLGDEWKGYVFRIAGGNDKQGFPMKQGILTTGRVRLLFSKGHSCFRERRTGERRRKSVRGCIVDANLSVLAVVIVKKGDQEIPGLTDVTVPKRLGPKRASKIRELFNLSKDDDVTQYVIKRPLPLKERNRVPFAQDPAIGYPSCPPAQTSSRCPEEEAFRKQKDEAASYARLLAVRTKEAKQKRAEELKRRRSRSASKSSVGTQ